MGLDINYKKKKCKKHKHMQIKQDISKYLKSTEEIKREIKKFLETNVNENITQNPQDAAKAVLIEKFIANTILPQEITKTLNR